MVFPGWAQAFDIDEVLEPHSVYAAHDLRGARYIIAHTTPSTWLCAPVTELALARVAAGDAELRDAFRHSSTGTVEKFTVHGPAVVDESLTLCGELTDDELPEAGLRIGWAVRCA